MSNYTVPTAFVIHPADVDDIVGPISVNHVVVGHRLVDAENIAQDPRFAANLDELLNARQGNYQTILVMDIVAGDDDWFDAELLAEVDHLPLFCYPGEVA